jgi:transcriptional regulator with XRE-family HTH domain
VRPGQQEARDLLGAILRYYRVKAGLTQKELAQKSGVSTSTISEIERGACGPASSTVLHLCEGLAIEPDVLFDGSTWNIEEQRWNVDPEKYAAYLAGAQEKVGSDVRR